MANEVVDSRYSSAKEQRDEAKLLMEARKQRMSKLAQADNFKAKLMQLKLQMEEFMLKLMVHSERVFKVTFIR